MDTSRGITRREALKQGLLGAAGLLVLPAVSAACGTGPTPTSPPTAPPTLTPRPTPTLTPKPSPTLGGALRVSNYIYTDNLTQAMHQVNAAFTSVNPGVDLRSEDILPGTTYPPSLLTLPEAPDIFTWYSGSRMRFYASTKAFAPIDNVWTEVEPSFTDAFARAMKGDDGHVYGIPTDFYPWAVFYRKSVWQSRGYSIPTTWDDLLALCSKMQKDGLTSFAFGDKDGWPAMAIFDHIDLRLNGYDFHMKLLTGGAKWTDNRVTAVFERWRDLMPFVAPGAPSRTWQTAAETLASGKAGMMLIGTFIVPQLDFLDRSGKTSADLDFFPFPGFGNKFDAEKTVEAPVNMMVVCANARSLADDRANAEAYLRFWSKGSTQMLLYTADKSRLPSALDAEMTALSDFDRRAVELVRGAQRITQFFDRDSRPDFAGPQGMHNFLLKFVSNPDHDLEVLQVLIQSFWDGLPPM